MDYYLFGSRRISMSKLTRSERDKYETWLLYCQTEATGLTKWEEGFLDSIESQLKEKGWISERQAEILERIYSEKTS